MRGGICDKRVNRNTAYISRSSRTLKIAADQNMIICFWRDLDRKRAEVKSLERKRRVLDKRHSVQTTDGFEVDHTHVFWEGGDHDGDGRVIRSARQTLPKLFGYERHERM